MSPTYNPNKSRDIKHKQLIRMWQIALVRSALRKTPDESTIARITNNFDYMLSTEQREIWEQFQNKHRALLAEIKNGKELEGVAKQELENFFGEIAVSLDLTTEEVSTKLQGDEEYGRLIVFYRHTLCKNIFGETNYPDLVKEAFVNELEHPLPHKFHQLQVKYGRRFYKRIGELEKEGEPTLTREEADEMEIELELFFDEVANSMNIPINELLNTVLGEQSTCDEMESGGSIDVEHVCLTDDAESNDGLTELGDW